MAEFWYILLAGGLAFFLYGMHVLSSGLERMAGSKLEGLLRKMTSNPIKSLALGAGITIAIQSSSATAVMLVGLVNSGIMGIEQTVGVLMGSNIGTTLTAWLTSLIGISSDNIILKLLKPENFSLIFAFVGIILIMVSKKSRRRDFGTILVGFAVLMYGMHMMSDAVSPLAEIDQFKNLLTAFNNPLFGIVIGTLFTGVIQSSAASIAILQALALTGQITYGMAIPIILGQNIGTCVTAIISSIGVSKNAKKVPLIHITIKCIGAVLFMTVFYLGDLFFNFSFVDTPINTIGISIVHTIFNIANTVVLLPFSKLLIKMANLLLPEKEEAHAEESKKFIDSRLFATPSVAINECDSITADMAQLSHDTVVSSFSLIEKFSDKKAKQILENEDKLDRYEDELGTYLVQLSTKKLSEPNSLKVSKMLHSIGDFERLGDHAVNLLKTAEELHEKGLSFSEAAKKELRVLTNALIEILELTNEAYKKNDPVIAAKIEPLEQVIDRLVATIRVTHIKRLQAGNCSIEMGFILSDLLGNFERISDHCSNIAVSIIELTHNSFDTHKYLNAIKYGNKEFNEQFEKYADKYSI